MATGVATLSWVLQVQSAPAIQELGSVQAAQACSALARQAPGLSFSKLARLAHEAGVLLRVSRRDGHDLVVTFDFRLDRLDVAVRAGTVTSARCG